MSTNPKLKIRGSNKTSPVQERLLKLGENASTAIFYL
jgi:hypothetical protein